MANVETSIYDVLRWALDGLTRLGGISEAQHAEAHRVVDAADPATEQRAAEAAATPLTDAELEQLAALEARQKAAQQAQQPAPAEQPAPAVTAVPGSGFFQPPATGAPAAQGSAGF
jgi:hypothetical protein